MVVWQLAAHGLVLCLAKRWRTDTPCMGLSGSGTLSGGGGMSAQITRSAITFPRRAGVVSSGFASWVRKLACVRRPARWAAGRAVATGVVLVTVVRPYSLARLASTKLLLDV